MQRFNTFNMIHKALRALLYDTALTLQQTYFGDPEEADSALAKIEVVLQQFDSHAHHEDRFVLPAIEAFEPAIAASFEAEHQEDHKLGNQVAHLLNIFRATTLVEERIIAGSAICKAFMDFVIFNLKHMAKEESILNPVLWRWYTDAQLQEMNAHIVASIPDDEKAVSARWMMRGINKVEAVNWLKAIKQTAPQPVFLSVYSLTRSELPVHRRLAIQEGVLDGALFG